MVSRSAQLIALAAVELLVPLAAAELPQPEPLSVLELTVEAGKVAADYGETPASVTVTPGQQLDDSGVHTLDGLTQHLANVTAINLGTHTTYPVIRGATGLADQGPVLVQTFGISPRSLGLDLLLDVEQVEVLRGPQGTLYGRNSLAGVVNVVHRLPGDQWEGYGTLEAASYRTLSATAAAGGPLSDTVGVRFAAEGVTSDGWRTNTLTDDDQSAASRDVQGQGTVVWAMGSGWQAAVNGLAAHFTTSGDQFAPLDLARSHETANDHPGTFSQRLLAGSVVLTRISGETDVAEEQRTFTATTGLSDSTDVFDLDIDFSSAVPAAVLGKTTDTRQLSQEVRYSGGTGLRSWVVGLFAADDVIDVDAPLAVGPLVVERGGQQTALDLAAFGQVGLPLGPGWTLTLGLRAETVRTTVDYTATDNFSPGFTYNDQQTTTQLLPKAGVAYAWDDDVLTWVSATKGSTAGGYNLTPLSVVEIDGGYAPETVWSYELGQRVGLLDRRLWLSVTGFYMDWRDKQVTVLQPPSTYLINNAAQATIIGLESDNSLRIAPGVDLLAGVGVLRATFDEYQPSPAVDLSGNHLPMAPSYDGYLGAQWRAESGLFVRVDLSASGSYYADDTNAIDQSAYRTWGTRIGYEARDWALYVWGRNLTDEVYWIRASVTAGGQQVAVSSEPRMLGMTATARF